MALIRTRLAEAADRAALIAFIRDHWSARHVFVSDPELFDWQYQQADERINMMLAESVDDDGVATVLGVLGFIPMGRFDPALGDEDIMLALWKVRDDIAPPGLGLRLLKAVQAMKPRMIGAIGISDMVGPIYKALGYQLDYLQQAAVMNPAKRNDLHLAQGVPSAAFTDAFDTGGYVVRPLDVARDCDQVEALARKNPPVKSWAYVQDRYLDHPWYAYSLHMIKNDGALISLVIWREVEAQGVRILRIVDVIGEIDWLGHAAALLRPALSAADAEYIDIMGCGLDETLLKQGGFISPDWTSDLVLPNYFAPYEARNIRINLSWKRFDGGDAGQSMRLYRADSDQDRPNQPTPRRTF